MNIDGSSLDLKKKKTISRNILQMIYFEVLLKTTHENGVYTHNDFNLITKKEIISKQNIFPFLKEDFSKTLTEIILWKMIKNGNINYLNKTELVFVTNSDYDQTLLKKILTYVKKEPREFNDLFGYINIPDLFIKRLELMMKYLIDYEKVSYIENLYYFNKKNIC